MKKNGFKLVPKKDNYMVFCYKTDTGVVLESEYVTIEVQEGEEEAISDSFSYEEISMISEVFSECLGSSFKSYMEYLWSTLPEQYLCMSLEESIYVLLYNANFPQDIEACAENRLPSDMGHHTVPDILDGYPAHSSATEANLFRFPSVAEKNRFFQEKNVEVLVPTEGSEVYDFLTNYVN